MQKVLIFGTKESRDTVLKKLQEAGVLHIEPVEEIQFPCLKPEECLNEVDQALEILSPYCPTTKSIKVNVKEIPSSVIEIDKKLKELQEKKNIQQQKLSELEDWGDISSDLIQSLQKEEVQIRFWKCYPNEIPLFKAQCIPWQKVTGSIAYLVTVSYRETVEAPPGAQEIILSKGTIEWKKEIARTEEEIAEMKDLLEKYTGCFGALREYSRKLKDQIVLEFARLSILEKEKFFGLKGWVPKEDIPSIQEKLQDIPVALELAPTEENDEPPTLIRNPKWVQSILDLVKIYAIPGYKEWDPSIFVYFAFAIFFAMIIGDGGYGLTMFGVALYFRKRMNQSEDGQRLFRLLVTLSVSTMLWGLISCTWFAIDMNKISPEGSFAFLKKLKNFQICDASNNDFMMLLAIYIGVVHICIAHIVQIIRQWGSTVVLANMGWILAMWGAMFHMHLTHPAGKYLFWIGMGMVFLFSSTSKNVLKHIAEGLLGLTGVSQTFADVISYLRLFALGMAGTVMGSIFNQLGSDIQSLIPGIPGYILMLMLVFFGHTLNLVMSIMSGVIHGLRLNFLEFYRYCFEGTGHEYHPMALNKR